MDSTMPSDVTFCLRYLRVMEERDLATAKTMLDPEFRMVFPGDKRMTDLDALVKNSASRYRYVKKTFDETDSGTDKHGRPVVIISGTLYGEWPDGTPFSGIRYCDRFVLKGGRLLEQHVWNDLGEALRAAGR
ncbi:MAG: hypothetical protein ACK4PG_04880 [Acetobacteraceae bacterium]